MAPFVLHANSTRYTNRTYSGMFYEFGVELGDEDDIPKNIFDKFIELAHSRSRKHAANLKPYTFYGENAFMNVQVTLDRAPDVEPESEIGVTVLFESKCYVEDEPRNIKLRRILPEGFTATGKRTLMIHGFNPHTDGHASAKFVIKAGESVEAENRVILEIITDGRCSPLYVSFPLLG